MTGNGSLTIHNVREQIVGLNRKVPLLDGMQRQYVNFDNAASTPALRPVYEKVNEFMSWYSSVHRGTGFKSQIATGAYELAHEIVGCFVGADLRTNTVIFGKNTTEAINKLARRFPVGARRRGPLLTDGTSLKRPALAAASAFDPCRRPRRRIAGRGRFRAAAARARRQGQTGRHHRRLKCDRLPEPHPPPGRKSSRGRGQDPGRCRPVGPPPAHRHAR